MATREKTVIFGFPTLDSVADAVVTNFAQITVNIPETVIAFTSVFAEIGWQDAITATGGTVTEHRVALRLGAAGYTTVTELDDIANSGENLAGVIGPFDFTSHFTTNWSGTSMTCDVQVYFDQNTGTTLGMRNCSAVLYVTYTYDDDPVVNPVQLKTVRIPLESPAGALPTAANSNLGTSQIPALDTFLAESGKTIRDYFFQIEANEATNNSTVDWSLSVNVDGGTAFTYQPQESGLASDRFCRWLHKPSSVPATNVAHNFQIWGSQARANMVCVELIVTYEFDVAATTRMTTSILLPVEIATPVGVTTAAEASRFQRSFFIQEHAPSLLQSAFRINFNTTASIAGLRAAIGAQAFRAYTHASNVVAGMYCLQQRLDSGSAQGAGFALSRGLNSITLDMYATDTTDQATNVGGYIILNYQHDKPVEGVGAAAHTVMKVLLAWDALLADRTRINNYSFQIPESKYWIVGAGFMFYQWVLASSMAVTFDVECLPAESKGGGYLDIYADAFQADNERGCTLVWMRGRDVFKRHPDDVDPDRLDIEAVRDYRLYTSTTTSNGLVAAVTYHSDLHVVSGTVSGYVDADGAGLTVWVHRSDTGERVGVVTTTAGGVWSMDWYDDTVPLYAVCVEDSTHAGASALGTAV